jgi:hypothetical protein
MGKIAKGKGKEAVTKAKTVETNNANKIYQIKISLAESKPEIWRRVLVSGKTTLSKLHRIIQMLMLWEDYHLHEFTIEGIRYTVPDPEEMEPYKDEKRFHLYQAALKEGMTFLYIYDFGDDWIHNITVEKILDNDERFVGKPLCIGGALSGPPEDCGGIYGYYETLKAAKNKRHPEYKLNKEWLGKFDPEEFNLGSINIVLSGLR